MRTGDNRRSEGTRRSGNANDKEIKATEDERTVDSGYAHLRVRESGNGGGVGKRVKHVGNEEEASESTSNDTIVALLGRLVGGHARLGASERKESVLAKLYG